MIKEICYEWSIFLYLMYKPWIILNICNFHKRLLMSKIEKYLKLLVTNQINKKVEQNCGAQYNTCKFSMVFVSRV